MENNEKNENEFTYSSSNSFQHTSSKNYGFGRSFVVPFISGALGATLVVGTCFGIPSIKTNLIGTQSPKTSYSDIQTSAAAPINIEDYSNTAISVANKVLPSVVGITVDFQINSFFGKSTSQGSGSGIIISEDGYIVTNNHVIAGESSSYYYTVEEATEITINVYGIEETYKATVIGTDKLTDLAVLKIDAEGLTPAKLGNSDDLQVGEFVLAVGNPLGMDYSVTSGIVSAKDREITADNTTYHAIQTDAAINSGNSGGALANSKGEVIGINTLKLSGSGVEGMGFAIPISSTQKIIDQLIEFQTVKRPYIGIVGSTLTKETSERYNIPEGIYVEEVTEGSPAEKAGLVKSDIITKIEKKEVKSINELNQVKNTYNIGDTVTLTIYRDNKEQDIKVTLEETPQQNEETTTQAQVPSSSESFGSSIFDLFR